MRHIIGAVIVIAVTASIAACGSGNPAPAGAPTSGGPTLGGATSAPESAAMRAADCDFDKTMQHLLNPANSVPKPQSTAEYAQDSGFTTDELHSFFADICGDKLFTNIAGPDVLGPQSNVGVDPVASTFLYFLGKCNVIDMDADGAQHLATDGRGSIADAQAEIQKIRSHGCPRK